MDKVSINDKAECCTKVSVIIPIHNSEEYLCQCLESAINQTLEDIEIICVDDGSSDSSPQIIEGYVALDKRVRSFYGINLSAMRARAIGVRMAQGQYILFLDSDDYLEPTACEVLYNKIEEQHVEILQFSAKVENCANVEPKRVQQNERLLEPFIGKLYDDQVFKECFIKSSYGFTLWNKMFSCDLLKKAFSYMADKYLPKAQDLYTYFVVSYFAKSYYGWKSMPLYHYCLGRGVVASKITLDKFQRYCCQSDVVDALHKFCIENNIVDEAVKVCINKLKERWLNECIRLWIELLDLDEGIEASKILFKHWDTVDIIAQLSSTNWYNRAHIAKKLKKIERIEHPGKTVKTIAVYYFHYTIGGVQRVINILLNTLQALGYSVVLITDAEPSENDFNLSASVPRAKIKNYKYVNQTNIYERLKDWELLIKEYDVDMVIYHSWTSPLLLWDMIYLHSQSIPVIVQTHSIFTFSLLNYDKLFYELPQTLSLADGIVTISETDKVFWSAFSNRVSFIPNPVDADLITAKKTNGEHNTVTWIGRFSNEKQPWSAINIFEKVFNEMPNAKLYMIGDSTEQGVLEKYKQMAIRKGIGDNVVFTGFTENVYQYLSEASVNLNTSKFEGFPMTLVEAMAHGVPTIMYNMPYLSLAKEEYGIISVDEDNERAAADHIIRLLKNRDIWLEKHDSAYNAFHEVEKFDYAGAWKAVIEGQYDTVKLSNPERIMVQTICEHYIIGWRKVTLNGKNNVSGKLVDEPTLIRMSASYRIGRFITFIPRKIRGGIRCYKEHGMRYTLRRLQEQLISIFK